MSAIRDPLQDVLPRTRIGCGDTGHHQDLITIQSRQGVGQLRLADDVGIEMRVIEARDGCVKETEVAAA